MTQYHHGVNLACEIKLTGVTPHGRAFVWNHKDPNCPYHHAVLTGTSSAPPMNGQVFAYGVNTAEVESSSVSTPLSAPSVRQFETGATRDADTGKLAYEGFLDPLVLKRYAQFMHRHRTQSDGTLRDPDNWQRGIPLDVYADSGIRHVFEWWLVHRGNPMPPAGPRDPKDLPDILCAVMFNAMGYLHELLKEKANG